MMKKPVLPTQNASEAAQLKQLEDADTCPTCGSPMKAQPEARTEDDMGPERGGRHGRLDRMLGTDFPGYRHRPMKPMEKISGG